MTMRRSFATAKLERSCYAASSMRERCFLDVHKALAGSALMIEEVAFPREIFRNYGTYDEKLEYYGLTYQNIRKKLDKLITA